MGGPTSTEWSRSHQGHDSITIFFPFLTSQEQVFYWPCRSSLPNQWILGFFLYTEEEVYGVVCMIQPLHFSLLLDLTLQSKCIKCLLLFPIAWKEKLNQNHSLTEWRYLLVASQIHMNILVSWTGNLYLISELLQLIIIIQ